MVWPLLLHVVCYVFHPQCVVHCFGDAIEFILAMHNDRAAPGHSLCPDPHGGLSCRNVAKLDECGKAKGAEGVGVSQFQVQ